MEDPAPLDVTIDPEVTGPDPISLEQFDVEVGDHHEGYYYPPPQTIEKYQSRVVTLMDSDEIRRQGFVIGIARQQMAAQYAPDYAIFTKGEQSQKLIIVGLHENTQPEEATFFDLLKLLGFTQVTIPDGKEFCHQVIID